MLRLSGVAKRYGRGPWVLTDVDLETPPGEVAAITGGNGSGKSTLLRILAGVSRPSAGTVSGRSGRVVGYVPENFPRHDRMSAAAYLKHMGRVRGLSTHAAVRRADQLLDRLALAGGAHTALRHLSKGNVQKVALAQAVLVRPDLLVLDEPWSGLDASVHEVLAELIREVAEGGGAVVFTDHRDAVVRANASAIYEVGGGRLRHVTALAEIGAETGAGSGAGSGAGERTWGVAEVVVSPGDEETPDPADWARFPGVTEVARHRMAVTVRLSGERCDDFLMAALRSGWSVISVRRTAVAEARAGAEGREAG